MTAFSTLWPRQSSAVCLIFWRIIAEISGGVYRLPWISTEASPFGPSTTLYGTRFVSSTTSFIRRPMKRLIENTVFWGLVTAWRFATVPTSRSPSFVNATTDGVTRPPSALGMTTGSPPSITATTELVVPRSIPMIFSAMTTAPYCEGDAHAKSPVAGARPVPEKNAKKAGAATGAFPAYLYPRDPL